MTRSYRPPIDVVSSDTYSKLLSPYNVYGRLFRDDLPWPPQVLQSQLLSLFSVQTYQPKSGRFGITIAHRHHDLQEGQVFCTMTTKEGSQSKLETYDDRIHHPESWYCFSDSGTMEPYEFTDQETETPDPHFCDAFVKITRELGVDYLGISYFREEDIPQPGYTSYETTRDDISYSSVVPREYDLFALCTSWVFDDRQGSTPYIITGRSCSHMSGIEGGHAPTTNEDTKHSPAVLYSTSSGFSLDAPAIMLQSQLSFTEPMLPVVPHGIQGSVFYEMDLRPAVLGRAQGDSQRQVFTIELIRNSDKDRLGRMCLSFWLVSIESFVPVATIIASFVATVEFQPNQPPRNYFIGTYSFQEYSSVVTPATFIAAAKGKGEPVRNIAIQLPSLGRKLIYKGRDNKDTEEKEVTIEGVLAFEKLDEIDRDRSDVKAEMSRHAVRFHSSSGVFAVIARVG